MRTKRVDGCGEGIYLVSVPTLWATVIGACCHAWIFLAIWWFVYAVAMSWILAYHFARLPKRKAKSEKMISLLDELGVSSKDDWYDAKWQEDYLKAYRNINAILNRDRKQGKA
jgi:hypothetical protein